MRTQAMSDKTSTEASRAPVRSKAVVLAVDDDARVLKFVRTSLRLAGYDVITAGSGEEALRLVETAKPDVILLDLSMSPMDGFEVLRQLKPTRTRVIVVSAYTSQAGKALNLGADAFVGKPFRPDELVRSIRSVLRPTND